MGEPLRCASVDTPDAAPASLLHTDRRETAWHIARSASPRSRDCGFLASSLDTTIRTIAFFKILKSFTLCEFSGHNNSKRCLFSKLRVRGPSFPAQACKRASGTHRTRRSPAWRRARNRCQPGKAQAGWRIPRARKCCCSCRPQCAWGLCLVLRPGFWPIQQCL